MRFAALPDRRATDDPHGPAVADQARALTNAELLAAVHAAAGQEAAVVGIPDRTWSEVVVAYVQPAPLAGIDVGVLAQRCTRTLSRYERPVSIHVLDSLPTNAVGKIDKAVLRTRSAEGAPS